MAMNISTYLALALLLIASVSQSVVQANLLSHSNKILRLNTGQEDDNKVMTHQHPHSHIEVHHGQPAYFLRVVRHLLGHQSGQHRLARTTSNNSDDSQHHDERNDNCTNPRHPPQNYRDSCDFVQAECAKNAELIDYMAFVVCGLTSVQVSIHLLLLLVCFFYSLSV